MPLVRSLVKKDGTPLWRQRGRIIEVMRCGHLKGVPKWIKVAHLGPDEQLIANSRKIIKGPVAFEPASMSGVIVRCSIAWKHRPRSVSRFTETNVVTGRPVLSYIGDDRMSFLDLTEQWDSYNGYTPQRIHATRLSENSL